MPYLALAKKADAQAMRIRDALAGKGCTMRYDSPTNQQFPVLPDGWLQKLKEKYSVSEMGSVESGKTLVRFCTSWATRDEDVDALLRDIAAL